MKDRQTIRINGELLDWTEIDPGRAAAYQALAFARDRAHRLAAELDREANKLVDETRKEYGGTK